MTHQKIFAALLCGALLLSGCAGGGGAPAASSAPGSSVEAAGRPLSELEQIALQVEAWEKAGAYDDEGAYREALLRVLELARAEDDGSYRCEDPSQLSEDQLKALTDAALRCNYAYSIFTDFEPFSQEDLHATIGMLMIYTPGTLEAPLYWNMDGYDPTLPAGNYCYVKQDEILPFLARTLAPAAQAYRAYQEDIPKEWNWHETEDGYVYVDVTGLTATLPYSLPQFTGIEPLGGGRYLVRCDMLGIGHFSLAMVVEDIALPGEPHQVVVLDAVNEARVWGDGWSGDREWDDALIDVDNADVDRLRERYWVPGEGGQEAVDLLERLEALSPVPYHTELAEHLSPAMEQALVDAKITDDMISGDIFESYVQALRVAPTMHRYSLADEWQPADPDRETTYGDEWNLIPASELEATFQRRLNMDLTANGRAWLDNREFVPLEFESQQPIVQYDGENYIVYRRGIGYAGSPQVISLTYDYHGTYTAVFTDLEYGGIGTIRLRNIGTEEEPFFQLQGYALPE